jgi:hypothetical protein
MIWLVLAALAWAGFVQPVAIIRDRSEGSALVGALLSGAAVVFVGYAFLRGATQMGWVG